MQDDFHMLANHAGEHLQGAAQHLQDQLALGKKGIGRHVHWCLPNWADGKNINTLLNIQLLVDCNALPGQPIAAIAALGTLRQYSQM
ncbi:hypothetical protein PproGo58_25930 [Pseudomonas protegens]|nr:hypothetical protein PproGo58_25930 [Pseudomonas protegens]